MTPVERLRRSWSTRECSWPRLKLKRKGKVLTVLGT